MSLVMLGFIGVEFTADLRSGGFGSNSLCELPFLQHMRCKTGQLFRDFPTLRKRVCSYISHGT